MKRILPLILLFFCIKTNAEGIDSAAVAKDTTVIRQNFVGKVIEGVGRLLDVDTTYIEPQHFNFQALMEYRYSYEVYRLSDDKGNSIRFVPSPSMKIGPSVGWSIIFLGWSIDVLHLNDGHNRKEFDVSLYSLPVGVDLFWRQSGNDYRIKDIRMQNGIDTAPMERAVFDGIESSVKGGNLYYIFNHKRFSYPAAFNQSTRQKKSAGSAIAGVGFTKHTLNINWQGLNDIAIDKLGQDMSEYFTEEALFGKVVYTDLNISGGYGYNWVFAKNWLFSSSLSLAISHKQSVSDTKHIFENIEESFNFRDFKFSNLTLDGLGRFGIVWNNDRWFAGASAIVHAYNYSKSKFYTNNTFGSLNAYFGVNFGTKKKYRNAKNNNRHTRHCTCWGCTCSE